MALTHRLAFPLPNGLHARPASFLAETARRFACRIELHNEPRGTTANMKSVLSMVAADVHQGDACVIRCEGIDEAAACETVGRYIAETLPEKDAPLPDVAAGEGERAIPPSLASTDPGRLLRGRAVNGGVAMGQAVHVHGIALPATIAAATPRPAADEVAAFRRALQAVAVRMEQRAAQRGGAEADVLEVHRSLLSDPELVARVEATLGSGAATAAEAVLDAGRRYVELLRQSTSLYLRERVADLQDVVMQVLGALGHPGGASDTIRLSGPSVVFADHLTPGQFLSMDRVLLKGLVLGQAGTTSHTVILARSRGLPTLADAAECLAHARSGDEVVLDGELGVVIANPSARVRRYYASELARLEAMRQRNEQSLALPATPANGSTIEVAANVTSADEVEDVFARGADGIGLFRTEMLFLGRDEAPGEQEQFDTYRRVLSAAAGKPVILRTFDIGGDKPAPYLHLPPGPNPFLGNRGARLYASHPLLLRTQLRAMLRAARLGPLRILVPMITCVEEARDFRRMLEEARQALVDEGAETTALPPIGVMIEVPSAALLVPQLAAEVDFFSIGSNDLTQYLLATDRDDPAVASLYSWSHPSLWRLLKIACDDARAAGKWIGLCGELGGVPEALPLLVGLGLDEISISAGRIAETKRQVRLLDASLCRDLLGKAIACSTREQLTETRGNASTASAPPRMMSRELIEFDVEASTKAEAIKHLADRLWLADRAADPKLLELAIWAREATYSTGFGHGCAIPHCKTAAVRSSSIALARLRRPVMWNDDDTNPVDLILLIALREQDHGREHMRVLSQLSRLLMRDEFRDTLRRHRDADAALEFLNTSLNL